MNHTHFKKPLILLQTLLYTYILYTEASVHQMQLDKSVFKTLTTDLLKRKLAFIAELVSNSLDANRKLCLFYKDENADIGKDIRISIDKQYIGGKEQRLVQISDSGIGMTKNEIIKYIGTLGGSGTREEKSKDLIGRFGMGLYSVFLVAEKVEIVTRKVGEESAHRVTLFADKNEYLVDDAERMSHGTDVVVWLADNIEVTNKDVEEWVYENLLNDGTTRHFSISVKKSEEEIENETNTELERRKEANKKISDENKSEDDISKEDISKEDVNKNDFNKSSDNKQEDGKKDISKEDVNKEDISKEDIPKEDVNKDDISKKDIPKDDNNKSDINKDDNNKDENNEEKEDNEIIIDPYRNLNLAPWSFNNDELILKKIYTERYKKSDLEITRKISFTAKQKNLNGKEWNTKFEAMVFIPKPQTDSFLAGREEQKGKIEVFVSGCKITDPNLNKRNEFLKPFTFIIRSNEALISSTREEFYDSENTVDNILNALQRKIADIFSEMSDAKIHKYNKIIKIGYLESKRANKSSVAEKLSGIITFQTDKDVMSLNKFIEKIEKINNKEDGYKEDKEDDKEDKEGNNEDDNKEDNEDKEDNDKENENENEDKIKEKEKEKNELGKYKKTDSIFYTATSISLVKNILNPILDGVNVPYIFLNDIHDEEIVGTIKNFKGFKIVNISTRKFENRVIEKEDEEKFKEVTEYIKKYLSSYVSDVVLSKRLVKLPFSIIQSENSISNAYRSIMGENNLENNPFRSMMDPKPVLEINIDSEEIKKMKEIISENESFNKLNSTILTMFVGTCLACKVDLYDKSEGFMDLMNIGRENIGVEKDKRKKKKKKDENFDFLKDYANLDKEVNMEDLEAINAESESEEKIDEHAEQKIDEHVENKIEDIPAEKESLAADKIVEETRVEETMKEDL